MAEQTEKAKRVAIYIRVSTDSEMQDQSYNVTQEEVITKLINENPNEIFNPDIDIFRERESGTNFKNRKEFVKLLSLLGIEVVEEKSENGIELSVKANNKKPLYDKIYVKSYSRFSRSFFGEAVLKAFNAKHIELFFFDTRKSSVDIDPTQLKIESLISENFSRGISFNWRLYNYRQNQNRELLIRNNLYGYDRVKKADGKVYYEINPDEKAVLDLIYKMYLEDRIGVRAISVWLNKNGYTINGKPWGTKTILNIFRNQHYLGKERYFDYDKRYLTDYDNTIEYNFVWEDTPYIEAIIDEETFKNLNSEIITRTRGKRGVKIEKRFYSKILICGVCGHHYQSNGLHYKSNRYRYICRREYRKGNLDCNNHIITEDYLEEALLKQSKRYKPFLDRFYSENVKKLNSLNIWLILAFVDNTDDKWLQLQEEYNEKKIQADEVVKRLMGEDLESDTAINLITSFKEKYDKELKELEEKIEIHRNFKEVIEEKIQYISSLLVELNEERNKMKDSYSMEEYAQELSKVTVFPKEGKKNLNSVTFTYRLKVEDKVYDLFDEIYNKRDILDSIGKDKFKAVKAGKNLPKTYVIKEPTQEEIDRATPYFEEFIV